MTKRELIEEIGLLNPTAKPEFLARFDEGDLQEYLEHLRWVGTPGSFGSGRWEKRPTAPAQERGSKPPPEAVEDPPARRTEESTAAVAVAEAEEDPQAASPFADSSDSSNEESPAWLY